MPTGQYLRTPKREPTKLAIETMIVWLGSLRSKGRVIGDEACLCDGDDGIWRLDADKQSVQAV